MPKRIPISAASAIGDQYPDLSQVILVAWDGKLTHVVTWGRTTENCAQAAEGGNLVKRALGWPENLCNEKPSRVKTLEARIEELESELVSRLEPCKEERKD